jgi:hypothetical protein
MTLGFNWISDGLWIAWGGMHRSGKQSQTDCAIAALQRKQQDNNTSRFIVWQRVEKGENREQGGKLKGWQEWWGLSNQECGRVPKR